MKIRLYRPHSGVSTRYWLDFAKDYLSEKRREAIEDVLQIPFKYTWNKITRCLQPKDKIRIDYHDIWSADHTLARIIYPTLVLLKEHKHGSPCVDNEDVPEHLRDNPDEKLNGFYSGGAKIHEKWGWVLDEMIYAFSELKDHDWEDRYHSGETDTLWEKTDNPLLVEMKEGPKSTYKFDREGYEANHKRIMNGLRLFARYYQALWD